MSDRGLTENFIQGNWHHLTGTGNRRNKSWSQTATTRRALQAYLPVAMRNLIHFLSYFACFQLFFYIITVHLSSLHHILLCSLHAGPLCSATSICPTSFCIWLTHVRLISIIVINIASLPKHPDQRLLDKEATIKPGTYHVDRSDRASSAYIR